jgi:hypothetical protein
MSVAVTQQPCACCAEPVEIRGNRTIAWLVASGQLTVPVFVQCDACAHADCEWHGPCKRAPNPEPTAARG